MLNLSERTTRFTILSSPTNKLTGPTNDEITGQLMALPQTAPRSLTCDQGGEFADHDTFTGTLKAEIWYCDPHSPWQRGTVENTNGLIRRDMPRKNNITDYSDDDIQALMWNLNTTPKYASPSKPQPRPSMNN